MLIRTVRACAVASYAMSETPPAEGTRATLVTDPDRGLIDAWRALAVELGRPAALPEWVCPGGRTRELRIVALHDGGTLVGIAPFALTRKPWGVHAEPLGSPWAEGFALMARPAHELSLATEAIRLLRHSVPSLAALQLWSAPVNLAELLVAAAGSRLSNHMRKVAPFAALTDPDAEAWLAARSKNFRRSVIKAERALADAGGDVRVITVADELPAAIEAFFALHHSRWTDRGGSDALTREVESAVWAAAPPLLASGNLRLLQVTIRGIAVGSLLCLVAGRTYTTWLGGYNAVGADAKTGFLLRIAALRDAYALGAHTLDLGTGDADFKQRFASGEAVVVSGLLCEPGWRGQLAFAVSQSKTMIPPPRRKQLRTLLSRG